VTKLLSRPRHYFVLNAMQKLLLSAFSLFRRFYLICSRVSTTVRFVSVAGNGHYATRTVTPYMTARTKFAKKRHFSEHLMHASLSPIRSFLPSVSRPVVVLNVNIFIFKHLKTITVLQCCCPSLPVTANKTFSLSVAKQRGPQK